MSVSKVTFCVKAHPRDGGSVVLLGDAMPLGSFNTYIPLLKSRSGLWTTSKPITLPRGRRIKYRYAVVKDGKLCYWERIGDRTLIPSRSRLRTDDTFGTDPRRATSSRSLMTGNHLSSRSLMALFGNSSPIRSGVKPGSGAPVVTNPAGNPSPGGSPPRPTAAVTPPMATMPPVTPVMVGSPVRPLGSVGAEATSEASPPSIAIPAVPASTTSTFSSPLRAVADAEPASQSHADRLATAVADITLGGAAGASAGAGAGVGGGGADSAAAGALAPTASPTATPSGLPPKAALSELLAGHKVIIVTFELPVVLRHLGGHKWTASWDEDNIIARSCGASLADEVSLTWVGCVTARCLDRSSSADAMPRRPSSESLSSLTSADEHDDTHHSFTDADKASITAVLKEMDVTPIFVPTRNLRKFSNYCTNVLSPAMHNVMETSTMSDNEFSLSRLISGFEAFRSMNQYIAQEARAVYTMGDALWVYGYELAIFPQQFASLFDHTPAQVFFLSTPFPTSEVFRALSIRDDLLDGMLAANVVGFHTFNHARHFMQCCKRVAGLNFQSRAGGGLSVEFRGRDVLVAVTHVGLQVPLLKRWMSTPETARTAEAIRAAYPGRTLCLTFAQCDRLSGVSLMLLAVELLMKENPVFHGRLTFLVRVEVPGLGSRSVASGKWSDENHELVARINKQFPSTVNYEEALSFPPSYRVGLYYMADLLLHTPTMEGLNLIPFEYVFTRVHWFGPLQSPAAGSLPPSPPQDPTAVSKETEEEVAQLMKLSKEPRRRPRASLSTAAGARPPSHQRRHRHSGAHRHPAHMPLMYESLEDDDGSDDDESDDGTPIASAPAPAAPGSDLPAGGVLHASPSMDDLLQPEFRSTLTAPLPPRQRAGMVILSEFATASHAMNSHIQINPWAVDEVASAIAQAVHMDTVTRLQRQYRDCHYIARNPVWQWTKQVLTDLLNHLRETGVTLTEVEPSSLQANVHSRAVEVGSEGELVQLDVRDTVLQLQHCKNRVIVLDYNGTLVAEEGLGRYVKREYVDETLHREPITPALMSAASRLAADPHTTLCLVSDMKMTAMEETPLAAVEGVVLAAEDGSFISRGTDADGKRAWIPNPRFPHDASPEWVTTRTLAHELMEEYCSRVSGTRVVRDDESLKWSYRNSDPEWGGAQAGFLVEELKELCAKRMPVSAVKLVVSKDYVGLSLAQKNRGVLVQELLLSMTPGVDCVLCVGTESNDEDMFVMLHAMLGDTLDMMSPVAQTPLATPVAGVAAAPHLSLSEGADTEDVDESLDARAVVPIIAADTAVVHSAVHAAAQDATAIATLQTAVTVCVGRKRTNARFFVHSSEDVHHLLQALADTV